MGLSPAVDRIGGVLRNTALWNTPHTGEEYRPLLPYHETSLHILSTALSPLDKHKWRRKPWYWRLFKVLKVSRRGWEKGIVLGDAALTSPFLPGPCGAGTAAHCACG